MGAETTYYAKVPKVFYEWIEVSALTSSDVRKDYPEAIEILHWTEFNEMTEDDD